MNRKIRIVTLGFAVVIAATGVVALAGDLNPPPGPITSTMKTLVEVEPRVAINATNTPGGADSLFKITQRGSYFLTGNITGVVGKHGIEIVASGVTLDLNGFDLVGVPGMGPFAAVSVTEAGVQNIAVVNGSVREWGAWGVDLFTFSAQNCRVADMLASDNGLNGIGLGTAGTVTNCSANSNTGQGIVAGNGNTVTNCSAYANTGKGIEVSPGCTVTGCTVQGNSGIGIDAGFGCTVANCSAYGNAGDGIKVGQGSAVANCSARSNTGSGFNHIGIGTISHCSAYQNTGDGILLSAAGCSVSKCSASYNTGIGIRSPGGSMISDCTVQANTLDGVFCTSNCAIRGNTCSSNGNGAGDGAGIHATGNDNRIEGNNCTVADRGIDVDATGNIIIRNTCSGNTTNWSIVTGNAVAPIVQASTNAAAISGNTYAGSLGSTDPNANFTY